MGEYPNGDLSGFTVTDNGDGSYTLRRDGGDTRDPAFLAWYGSVSVLYPAVSTLVRAWSEGRRGAAAPGDRAPYRPTTLESVTFRLDTLEAERVPLSSWDTGGYPVTVDQDFS